MLRRTPHQISQGVRYAVGIFITSLFISIYIKSAYMVRLCFNRDTVRQ